MSTRIPTVNDLRVRFLYLFRFFFGLFSKLKSRSNFAIFAGKKNIMAVVSISLETDRKLEPNSDTLLIC